MNYYDIKRYGLILAVQAEIDGMKAENDQRKALNDSMAYTDKDFFNKAEEIRVISFCHNEQL
jgi:hypothetical protein